jgi:hypothetical protein
MRQWDMEAGREDVRRPWDVVAVVRVAVDAAAANPSNVPIPPGCGCIGGIFFSRLSDTFFFTFAFGFAVQFQCESTSASRVSNSSA